MENLEKLKEAFANALNIDKIEVDSSLHYNSISNWDSVSHMAIIAAIEELFDIIIAPEDFIEIDSFNSAIDILKKYEIII